ncbi:putative protein N(5)-glutamine methyltransferase [Plantibacter flavus]|uniref:putative protein N(5)-glutamine methyltransferase n=1 Tax=Plantibacter flavus TaxID=150123 RepID=UPI003F5CEB2D
MARLRSAGCVFAEEEAALLLNAARDARRLDTMVAERVAGRPLEHVLGWATFRGLQIIVADGVFVPRLRTGLLVDAARERLRDGSIVIELCCGAGAVSAALLTEAPGRLTVWASDIDQSAVAVAHRNLDPLGGHVVRGDLFDGLPQSLRSVAHVIVANAPYVPTTSIAMMPPEAREHEARIALDGGSDGLDVQRRLIVQARAWLAPGGAVIIETSELQAESTAALMSAVGLAPTILQDERLDATAVVGVMA